MLVLKQSTAVTLKIGPFLDSTDGNTEESALTISQADVKLSKNGGAFTQKTEATSCTVDGTTGMYGCPVDATDTGTLGRLQLLVHEAGALAVWHEYMVVPANVWDSLYGADALQVHVVEQSDIDFGATQKASINTEADNALNTAIPAVNTADSVNDLLLDHLKGESDSVLADTGELQTDWVNGGRLDLLIDAVLADTGELQTDWANGGRLDLLIDAILADTGELQTDWVNGGRLDLLIDAIKAITDLLTLAAIADAVHDEAVEGAYTSRQATKAILAALAGKTSEAVAGTMLIRDVNDTANRITATMDANRYRTAVTLSL